MDAIPGGYFLDGRGEEIVYYLSTHDDDNDQTTEDIAGGAMGYRTFIFHCTINAEKSPRILFSVPA